jgi:hypothetical protein
MAEWRYSSIILNLGTRWMRVATFTPLPFKPQGNGPRYPMDRRLGGPQSRTGRCDDEKNALFPPGIEPQFPRSSSRLIYRLSYSAHSISWRYENWEHSKKNGYRSLQHEAYMHIRIFLCCPAYVETSRWPIPCPSFICSLRNSYPEKLILNRLW